LDCRVVDDGFHEMYPFAFFPSVRYIGEKCKQG